MIVPCSYQEWKECITVKCGIPLSLDYVQSRIKALDDETDYHTRRFVEQWGQNQLDKTKSWFRKAEQELISKEAG